MIMPFTTSTNRPDVNSWLPIDLGRHGNGILE
jgi:hypothetical protein